MDTIGPKERLLKRGGIEFRVTMTDEELSRYLAVLADLVKEKKIALTKLDRLLGWRGGMVGRLLRGERDLRLSQLLAILKILQVEPLSFFRVVYADRSVSTRLMESLAAAAPASAPLVVPPMMSEEEFSKLIRTVLDDALAARETRADPDRPQD
jgi:transcriptional regulator with XRE-family HTH domain